MVTFQLGLKALIAEISKTAKITKFAEINPKQAKGGRNQDAACLDTLPVQQGKGKIIKPPSICHFACPKQLSKFKFRIHMKTF